jgi:hypothetical protein
MKDVQNKSRRFAFIGPKFLCPYCSARLPIYSGATLQAVTDPDPVIDHNVLDIISTFMQAELLTVDKTVWHYNQKSGAREPTVAHYRRARCECGEIAASLFWLEIEEGVITGPWCGTCFARNEFRIWQDQPQNVRVWMVSTAEFAKYLDKRFTDGSIEYVEEKVPQDEPEEIDLDLF